MNGKALLALFAAAGVTVYILRDKIAEGVLALQDKVKAWAEDGTEDEPDHQTFPENTADGYPVGHHPR